VAFSNDNSPTCQNNAAQRLAARDTEAMMKSVDLREKGIDHPQAADLRRRLAQFAEDWDRPDMAAYDELPPR